MLFEFAFDLLFVLFLKSWFMYFVHSVINILIQTDHWFCLFHYSVYIYIYLLFKLLVNYLKCFLSTKKENDFVSCSICLFVEY